MSHRSRRGDTPAALVDDLLRELAKVEESAAAELGVHVTAVRLGGPEVAVPEATSRTRRTLRHSLWRWRNRGDRAAGLE